MIKEEMEELIRQAEKIKQSNDIGWNTAYKFAYSVAPEC